MRSNFASNGNPGVYLRVDDVADAFSISVDAATTLAVPVTSSAVAASWMRPPLGSAMSGRSICPDDGCAIASRDIFGEPALAPVVVALGVEPEGDVILDGPAFVLVANGREAVVDLAMSTPAVLAVADATASTLELSVPAGGLESVPISTRSCGAGFGSVEAAGGETVICQACPSGRYSDVTGWLECTGCFDGLATNGTGATACLSCADVFDATNVVLDGCAAAVVGLGGGTPWWVWVLVLLVVAVLVAVAAAVAWKYSRRKVISTYYIDEDATITIDEKHLRSKVKAALNDSYCRRIGGGEFTGSFDVFLCCSRVFFFGGGGL